MSLLSRLSDDELAGVARRADRARGAVAAAHGQGTRDREVMGDLHDLDAEVLSEMKSRAFEAQRKQGLS